jgi:hypothetical protein
MLLALASLARAAPPASAADVQSLLTALYSPDSAARLRAADALAQTPPALVPSLDPTRMPCWQEPEDSGCRYHNHALYHLVRVHGLLARRSVAGDNAWGRACREARGLRNEGPCPAVDQLRWMAHNPFTGFGALSDEALPAGSPPEVRGEVLEAEARRLFDEILALPPDAGGWDQALVASAPGLRWSALPRCGGVGFYAMCAWHLRLEREGQPALSRVSRELPMAGLGDQQLHLTASGALGVLLYSGEGAPQAHVFDLRQQQAPLCVLTPTEPVSAWTSALRSEECR